LKAHSTAVLSAQKAVHPRLHEIVARHIAHLDRSPIADFSKNLWPQIRAFIQAHQGLVLDLGCGTGMSTLLLASRYPNYAVIGVDRSEIRLQKTALTHAPTNALLLRADQYDLLRLLHLEGLIAEKCYLLYPNPSPKAEHIKRRWHGHPIWPTLLRCCKTLELRTNWEVYAQEFAQALAQSGWQAQISTLDTNAADLSLFEKKYRESGHGLWRVVGQSIQT
jgi:tRNA (guanine-N7-)-methyltransferase